MAHRWQFFITGKVQGVFYRASCEKQAKDLGVTGYVRNLSDGRVEVLAEGNEEQLKALLDWCKAGSSEAKVEQVVVEKRFGSHAYNDFQVTR